MTKANKEKPTFGKVFKIALIIFCGLLAIAVEVFGHYLFGEGSIFNRDISTTLPLLNKIFKAIPSLIRTAQIIFIALLLNLILKGILYGGFSKSRRSTTIVKLLCNFLKWVIALVALFIVLGAWGVDTKTLLASAGILTLVIGLGAQSLVADIVAGLFIVFENEYQVGDIVVIDGWRGTVQEIGIRSTRIEDAGGNIKIINNSAITTVINQTRQLSLATCVVGIEYQESLERVETVIRDNLPLIKSKIPAILDGPFYKGVDQLAPSSVNLLLLAKCNEADIYQVKRDLNREIKLIFDKNNINIPFSQVVVNAPTEDVNTPSLKTQIEAQRFVNDQKIRSKHIEEEEN